MATVSAIADAPTAVDRAPVTPRGRLFRKYVLLFATLISSALLASGLIDLYFAYQENKAALVAVQREKAVAAASRIEAFVKEIERQVAWTAQFQLGTGGGGVSQRRFEYLWLLRQVPAITDLTYLDADGKEQLRVSRLAVDVIGSQLDFSRDPRFLAARERRVYYGPVYFRKGSEPYMTLAMASSGQRARVTVAEVNLKFIWDVVSQIRVGRQGHAYVVDGDGTLIAHPDISVVLQKRSLASLPQVRAAMAPAAPEGTARDEVVIARNLGDHPVLTAHAAIAPLRWVVFVEQPLEEAFQPLYASIRRTAVLLILGVALSIVVSLVLARRVVTPIRSLQAGAERLGAGDLGHHIDVRTGDELEALALQFNRMAEQLQESYGGLERRVKEATHELREALAQQTATAEILRVISSSPTAIQPVLHAVAENATRLCEAKDVAIALAEGNVLQVAASYGTMARWWPEKGIPINRESVTGRAFVDRKPVHVHDLAAVADDEFPLGRIYQKQGGHRTSLAVPLLREGAAIGVMAIRRLEVRPFSEEQIALLRTFADQAVIAIENARLFQELREKSHQLEIANRHKTAFLANMSHELRTPLNAIIGFSEVLLDASLKVTNQERAQFLTDILNGGKHLLTLINEVLDLARVEAGRLELHLEPAPLREIIEAVHGTMRPLAARKAIELRTSHDGEVPLVVMDAGRVKQVLLNLVGNAVKFTPAGGQVWIHTETQRGAVCVEVGDTGPGIPVEDHERIFLEFQQVKTKGTAGKPEGTGLGLALARKFVEMHGGKLWLESAPGRGSRFYFTLPLTP